MSQQNINLDVLDEQLRTVEVDLGLLKKDSNDGLHQVPSTSSGVMNDFVIISDKPISQEVVEGIGMPEPTNEQKSIKLKFLEEKYGAEKKANKASGVPAKNNEGTEISNNDSKENSAIKLYTPEKIEEIKKHIDPKQTIDTKVNIGYYYRKHFDINPLNNKQLIRIKRDQVTGKIIDTEVKKVVVSTEDLFDVCMEIHKKLMYSGLSGMEKEARKLYYNISRPIIIIFLKYSTEKKFS